MVVQPNDNLSFLESSVFSAIFPRPLLLCFCMLGISSGNSLLILFFFLSKQLPVCTVTSFSDQCQICFFYVAIV